MTDRYNLIARKQEVRARIERTQRELAQEQRKGEKANHRHLARLESDLERLVAEEYRLRLAIDQSRRP